MARYNQNDDESTPRTGSKSQSGEYGPETYGYRLGQIEEQNRDQTKKLDRLLALVTIHVERQEGHANRISAIERGFLKVMWTAFIGCAGALGSLVVGLLPHSDKVTK